MSVLYQRGGLGHRGGIPDELALGHPVQGLRCPRPTPKICEGSRSCMGQAMSEELGKMCLDGGVCHHGCEKECFRRRCCAPFSDYVGPWSYDEDPREAFIRAYEQLCRDHRMIVDSCGACSASPALRAQPDVWVGDHIKKLRENSRG